MKRILALGAVLSLGAAGLALEAAGLALGAAAEQPRLRLWRRGPSGAFSDGGAGDLPLAAGSLQKPFVAKAWASAHPGEAPPVLHCGPGAACWFKAGHGDLDLPRALTLSCNAYFRALAAATPGPALAESLGEAGFRMRPLTSDLAIGLPGEEGPLTIRPSALLEAYVRLVKVPWTEGEPVRRLVLAGLREAALTGTAGGLGRRGHWAKTGTVPAADGNPLRTCGLVLTVDDAGEAVLARREPGTGREAAAALGRPGTVAATVPQRGTEAEAPVTVRLMDLLRPRRPWVRNLGAAPVPFGQAYLGPGAQRDLQPGDEVGPGLLEVGEPRTAFRRRLQGALRCGRAPGGGPSLVAVLSPREYVGGVLAGELPMGSAALRLELGAAVLRFLRQGPRHGDADVCDSTHCAWFIGRGPRLDWREPGRAALGAAPELRPLSDAEWREIQAAAPRPGPRLWTAHCGGRPLAPHTLWGGGDREAPACARHGAGAAPWVREWPAAALQKAFGGPVQDLAVAEVAGIWTLRVRTAAGGLSLGYDEAHRRLASVLGWEALPSPAEGVEPSPTGFRARGNGSGHRVGLCLGD